MNGTQNNPLGFETARRVVELGRSAFFRGPKEDKPKAESPQIAADDLLPQFGYVGSRYESRRILFLGINPGSGQRDERNEGDKILMPALEEFTAKGTAESFVAAQRAYRRVCQRWQVWGRQCDALLQAGEKGMEEIAYTNALPWRTYSGSGFSKTVARHAARLYAVPMVRELRPSLIVAVGKKAAEILGYVDLLSQDVVVLNCARARTPDVKAERKAAKEKFRSLLHAQDLGAT